MIAFFTTQTTNATSTAFTPAAVGDIEFVALGTWGGGTVKLQQLQLDGTTWLDLASLTANGRAIVTLAQTGQLRAVLSGATSPSLTARAFGTGATGVVRADNVAS